jgi:hypothetical protein
MTMEDEQTLKKHVVKGHWSLAKDKASIHAGMERVQSYEEAFTQIQRATGISDIDTLVRQFIENEDQNFKMFNYLNELNQEIEKGEEQITECAHTPTRPHAGWPWACCWPAVAAQCSLLSSARCSVLSARCAVPTAQQCSLLSAHCSHAVLSRSRAG